VKVILATGGFDHKIRFWDATTGVCSRSIRFNESQVNCLQISPDRTLLAAGGNPQAKLFRIDDDNPNPVLTLDGHTSNITSIGFQQEMKWVYTCSEDRTIKIWDLRAPGWQHSFQCQGAVNSVVLHPNQVELISGDQLGNVRVWDLMNLSCVNELYPDGDKPIRSVAIASDACAVVAGNNQANVFIWKPETSKNYIPKFSFKAHEGYLLKCAISPNSRYLATTSSDRSAKVWDIQGVTKDDECNKGDEKNEEHEGTNKERNETDYGQKCQLDLKLYQHTRWVWDAVFSADSSFLVTASSDHSARLWDLKNNRVVRHYQGSNLAVTCVALDDGSC